MRDRLSRSDHGGGDLPGVELNDMHALVVALTFGAGLGYFERNPIEVERLASELIELSTRQNFVRWLAGGEVLRG